MIKEKKDFFGFLYYHFFPEKAQNKPRSGSRRPFINDVNT